MKPESFVLTTDYATLKNDASANDSLTISGGTIASAGDKTVTEEITLGTRNSSLRIRMASDADGDYYPCTILSLTRTGSTPTIPSAPYSVLAFITRSGYSTLTLVVTINNPYAETLTLAGSETINFEINTFLSPFE